MRKSARIAAFARLVLSAVLALGLSFVFLFSLSAQTNAQTTTAPPAQQPISNPANDFHTPNVAPDVPRNSHTYAQIVTIDVLSAIACQLSGIDPVNPSQPCIGVNPATGQFGYAPTSAQFGQSGSVGPQIGGAVGFMSNQIGYLYTPAISSSQYTHYLASNFGIIKSANAQAQDPQFLDCTKLDPNTGAGYGFCGLQIIFDLWVTMRDLAYAVLTIAFIFLALGVMLRFKVDPRTVMTLQNQIPRVIIAILLITFSYAIAGLMIDLMWTVTYTGINIISATSDAEICAQGSAGSSTNATLPEAASFNLIDNPLSFVNTIFSGECGAAFQGGLWQVAGKVSFSLGALVENLIFNLLGINPEDTSCGFWPFGSVTGCITGVFVWLITIVLYIIVVAILLITLFRLWFVLLRTYISLFIFIILGPIWIVAGLIPGRPLGFEKWIRVIFANLAAFPLVAFVLVFGRVLMDSIPQIVSPQSIFIPPLIGNPNVSNSPEGSHVFGVLLGFGALLLAPTIPDLIKEKMKAQGSAKYGAALGGAAAMGAGMATAPASKAMKHLNRRNAQTGKAEGALAVGKQQAGRWVAGKTGIGRSMLDKSDARREHARLGGSGKETYQEILARKRGRGKDARQQDHNES